MIKNKRSLSTGFSVKWWKYLITHVLAVFLFPLRLIAIMRNFACRDSPKRSVLLIEPFGLGDVVTHEPLVGLLKNHGYNVFFCGRSVWNGIIPGSESVHWQEISVPWAVASFAKKYCIFGGFFPSFLKTVRSLAKIGKGTIGIDTRGDIRSILLLHLAGCSTVYTLSHYIGSSMRIPHCGVHHVWQDPEKKRWQLNLDFASALGIDVDISTVAPPNLNHLLRNHEKPDVSETAMIPFAAGAGKRWPVENWQTLIRQMKEHGEKVRWFCGPGQKAEIVRCFGESAACTEVHSVQQWVEEISMRKAVVSVNTGPMHIAAALNKPLIVLDGSSTLPLWMPEGKRTILIHHQKEILCAPCHQVDADLSCGNECMKLITPEEVMDAFFSLTDIAHSTGRNICD